MDDALCWVPSAWEWSGSRLTWRKAQHGNCAGNRIIASLRWVVNASVDVTQAALALDFNSHYFRRRLLDCRRSTRACSLGAVKVPTGSVNTCIPPQLFTSLDYILRKGSDQLLFFFWMLPRLRQWLSVSFGFQLNCHSIRDALLGALRVGPGHISIGEKREE